MICDFALDDFRKSPSEQPPNDFLSVCGIRTADGTKALMMRRRADTPVIAVNKLAPSLDLKAGDMEVYAEGIKVNEAWGIYARGNWR